MANNPYWRMDDVPPLTVESPDLEDGGAMPEWARSASVGGGDVSPALRWSGAPEGTRGYLVTCFDPDAPTGSGWWHWAVCGLPATTTALDRDAGDPDAGLLPDGAVTLPNETRGRAYQGAAPPPGHGPHRYVFTVWALDTDRLDVDADATPAMLVFLAQEHVTARGRLVVTSETAA